MPRYELVEGTSSKFWEISLDGTSFTTHWGRIGTAGQSTTKKLASAAEAKKEHDKLVAEKVKKGYKETGASSAPPPAPPKAKKKAAGGAIRADLSVYNEATAFLVTSASMAGKELDPRDAKWKKAVEAGDLLPVELVQDDSFIIRLVVGELGPEEEEEWVGRIAWKLRVPDGKLAVAGGFELVMEPVEGGGGSDYLQSLDALRVVDVPPGEYRAELLAFLNGVNGHWLLDHASPEKEPIGAWFRRTRPKEKFPPWLRRWCRSDPDMDPGHEAEWAKGKEKETKSEAVDFLLRLAPLAGELSLPAIGEGCFGLDAFEARKPARCPLGIVAKDPVKNPPPPPPAPLPPVATIDVLARVKDRPLAKVAGGPIEHPVTQLMQVYRIPWLATDAADPEIRLELPEGASFDLDFSQSREIAVTKEGRSLRVGFASGGGAKWGQIYAVRAVGRRLDTFPDGSVLELATAHAPDPKQHRDLGVSRWRGEVRGGAWRIAETYPALDAKTLREALDLSIAIDDGKRVALRDAAEGEKALELSKDVASLFRKNPIVVKPDSIGLTNKDDTLMHWVGGYVFRTRWNDVWPCWVEPEEERKAREEFLAKLKKRNEELAKKVEKVAAPKGPRELILEGKVGKFEKIDMKKERPTETDFVDRCDRQMKELGLEPLGDVVCSRFPDVLVRGYARAGGDAWAAFLAGVLQSSFDFFTHWPTAGYTTTMNDSPSRDDPKKGVYISHHPKLNFFLLKELSAKHEKRKKTLAKKLGTPLATEPTLRAFAEALDRGVARQLGMS
jgi:predicted DNA-binding WGR domain protein